VAKWPAAKDFFYFVAKLFNLNVYIFQWLARSCLGRGAIFPQFVPSAAAADAVVDEVRSNAPS
jgi:hypothetical protein